MTSQIKGAFEGKKHALRQNQDGMTITFVVHPSDMSPELAAAPLGTIFMVGYAEVVEGHGAPAVPAQPEEPAKERRPFNELTATEQAVLTCKDARFWRWVSEHDNYQATEADARRYILDRCDVTSRAHLREPPAAIKFFQILTRYRKATGLDPWTPE